VEMLNTSRCAEIDTRFPGLIAAIITAHETQAKKDSGPKARKIRSVR